MMDLNAVRNALPTLAELFWRTFMAAISTKTNVWTPWEDLTPNQVDVIQNALWTMFIRLSFETKPTDDQIELAGRMVKVLQLASEPGHDRVSIALNCGLMPHELKRAKMWDLALQLAAKGGKPMELAVELQEAMQ